MKTWLEISQGNILVNIKSLRSLLKPKTLFMAVVKSNAYGHGLEEMGKICVQSKMVDWFGVDNIDEALILRKNEVKQPILILGHIPFDMVGKAIENNCSFVAYNNELLDYLSTQNFKKNKKAKIHIKVETGTVRQGIEGEELLGFVKRASENPNIAIEGVYTHYANIEDTTDPSYAMEQLKRFNENVKKVEDILRRFAPLNDKLIKHSACSAALINYPETHFNMVRAGISIYGMWPSNEAKIIAGQKNVDLALKPALTWKTQIVQIKKLPANMPIGYGLTEKTRRETTIGILPIGYWDGYDRKLSTIGEVIVGGKRAKVLGRICMNMTVIDITDIPEAKLFNNAVLLGKSGGEEITVEELAKKINTINYEITTRINPLLKRIIK